LNPLAERTCFSQVLTGGSAGGLSTFLHADRVAARVKAAAPEIDVARIFAAPVVGYFLDHGAAPPNRTSRCVSPTVYLRLRPARPRADNFKHDSASAVPNTPSWGHANYTTWMRYIYKMQNLTFGADGGLTKACQEKHPAEPGLCFMSPRMQDVIQTPFCPRRPGAVKRHSHFPV
jgi:hypothetical protein